MNIRFREDSFLLALQTLPPPPPQGQLAMKVVRQARLELSGGSTPDLLRPSRTALGDRAPVPEAQGGGRLRGLGRVVHSQRRGAWWAEGRGLCS